MSNLSKQPNETIFEYKYRVCQAKELSSMSWNDVTNLINSELGTTYAHDSIRRWYNKQLENETLDNMINNSSINENEEFNKYLELELQKKKLQENRTQINGMIRALSREETLKEIAKDAVEKLSSKKQLERYVPKKIEPNNNEANATLIISDWHYGLDVDTYCNKYSPEIAKDRINLLLRKTLNICAKENITDLVVVNLGDMISGNIHLPLRLNSRIDVITQTMQVSELLAEFLYNLAKEIPWVRYVSTTDNHSRLDPNKKEALQVESFTRIIDWYLRQRLSDLDNFEFIENSNKFGEDIAIYSVFDYNIIAVHGDKDPQKSIVPNLSTFTQTHWDMILSAHMHHFTANECNETEFFCNSSLIGTDDFANSLRVNSKPSQILIVHTPENVSECVYKIKLN